MKPGIATQSHTLHSSYVDHIIQFNRWGNPGLERLRSLSTVTQRPKPLANVPEAEYRIKFPLFIVQGQQDRGANCIIKATMVRTKAGFVRNFQAKDNGGGKGKAEEGLRTELQAKDDDT